MQVSSVLKPLSASHKMRMICSGVCFVLFIGLPFIDENHSNCNGPVLGGPTTIINELIKAAVRNKFIGCWGGRFNQLRHGGRRHKRNSEKTNSGLSRQGLSQCFLFFKGSLQRFQVGIAILSIRLEVTALRPFVPGVNGNKWMW